MDGWGVNRQKEGNAVALARTPNINRLAAEYPSTEIVTSGLAVGLPEGQMGNSEVGHLTIGAGRVIYQELTRISRAVETGDLGRNAELDRVFGLVNEAGSALHLMGLVSDGGVHSHIDHLYGLLAAAEKKGVRRVFIHAFLDGRDTPPSSGKAYMEMLLRHLEKTGCGKVASVSGRYYAMDRDNRWDRVEAAYNAIVHGKGRTAPGPLEAVEDAYKRGETDEFVTPTVIVNSGGAPPAIYDNDAVLFFNFRSDRARELTKAIAIDSFDGFDRGVRPRFSAFVCMSEYDASFGLPVLFKPQTLENILSDILAMNGVRQFRVSETEKYAHVTFFFNGGREEAYPGEERLLIPSVRDVATYDLKPEMRAFEIAGAAVEKMRDGGFSFMLMNFANGDMVGHTGVIDAAVKACEAVDTAVGRVVDEALAGGWAVIITADHGNAEQMIDASTGAAYTAHTTNPVPLILVDDERKGVCLKTGGGLRDIAPTVLKLMGMDKPSEMDGEPFF